MKGNANVYQLEIKWNANKMLIKRNVNVYKM